MWVEIECERDKPIEIKKGVLLKHFFEDEIQFPEIFLLLPENHITYDLSLSTY